jgi:3-dehydroquinate dehydratase I
MKTKLPPLLQSLKKQSPLLVASLSGDDLPFLLEEARTLHADIVEIRLDSWGPYFRDDMSDKLKRFKERIGIPMLVSFRGGHPFPEWWQPMHWRALAHASFIDVEWNVKYPWKEIFKRAAEWGLGVIISHHDFKGTPTVPALKKIMSAAYAKGAHVAKLATRANTEADLRSLMAVSEHFSGKRLVTVMGMGPLGSVSRLMARAYGSCLIYGYIGAPTANGQLPYGELRDKMRAFYPAYEQGFQERLRLGREKLHG